MDANTAIGIVSAAITAFGIIIGIHERRATLRHRQVISRLALDKGYTDKTGELAHNGQLSTLITEYETICGKRDKFYNELIGEKVVKGG